MNVYRIDYTTHKAATRFWVDAPNALFAAALGLWRGWRLHRTVSHRPFESFTVTREAV